MFDGVKITSYGAKSVRKTQTFGYTTILFVSDDSKVMTILHIWDMVIKSSKKTQFYTT